MDIFCRNKIILAILAFPLTEIKIIFTHLEVFSYLVAETKDCEISPKCIVSVKFLINAVKRNV
jgi:hypothetical protein